MLHRLCGSPSIPLSFNLAVVLPRRDTYCVSCGTGGVDTPNTWYPSFTARTTGVSNPVRSPGFRPSASVTVQRAAFATGVPMHIYAFHRYLHRSALPSGTQAKQYRTHSPELSPGLSRTTYPAAYGRFTPSNSGQRSLPTYYRGCWHVVSRSFFCGYRHFPSALHGRNILPH